jgi:hypothetical protein
MPGRNRSPRQCFSAGLGRRLARGVQRDIERGMPVLRVPARFQRTQKLDRGLLETNSPRATFRVRARRVLIISRPPVGWPRRRRETNETYRG